MFPTHCASMGQFWVHCVTQASGEIHLHLWGEPSLLTRDPQLRSSALHVVHRVFYVFLDVPRENIVTMAMCQH